MHRLYRRPPAASSGPGSRRGSGLVRLTALELLPLLLVGALLAGVWHVAQQVTAGGARQVPSPTVTSVAADTIGVSPPTPFVPHPSLPASAPMTLSSHPPTTCEAGYRIFVHGLAQLKAQLGALMGEALGCEEPDAEGNTQQRTTSGLAYYRRQTNIAAFTNGWDRWALKADQVVHWTGEDLDPPEDAVPLPR
jgi:hypothetical protein